MLILPFGRATAVVDQDQQQNSICYIKKNAPNLMFGQLPFSCNGKPEKFVSHVKGEIVFISGTNLIKNFDKCVTKLFEAKNMTNVARGVWDLRDSPIMSTNAATASAISDACKIISEGTKNYPTKAVERAIIHAPIGAHIREVRQFIEFDPRNCNSYSMGPGIGCLINMGSRSSGVIKLGNQTPCRASGTVQLDFTNDFYLTAVSCGSNKELLDAFTQSMKTSYGLGEVSGAKEDGYLQTTWIADGFNVIAAENFIGDTSIYKVSIYKKP